jgi:two-component system chemotaxis response regulator CheY
MAGLASVLIIDDSSVVRQYYREVLLSGGHTVDEAANGYEALEMIYREDYDILIVDVNMPKMDGLSFLRNLRSSPELHQAAAIVISTEGEEEDLLFGYRAGCNLYLVKPVNPGDLLAYVEILG